MASPIYDLNQNIPVTDNTRTIPAPHRGTTGYRGNVQESVEVVTVPNIGKTISAPTNSPVDWSADLVKP